MHRIAFNKHANLHIHTISQYCIHIMYISWFLSGEYNGIWDLHLHLFIRGNRHVKFVLKCMELLSDCPYIFIWSYNCFILLTGEWNWFKFPFSSEIPLLLLLLVIYRNLQEYVGNNRKKKHAIFPAFSAPIRLRTLLFVNEFVISR